MNGILYYNRSNRNVVNKDLTSANTLTVHYKENTDIINPEIIISPDVTIKNYNYIKVSGDIERYYYIDDYEYSQQYCILKCHVDVLMTYKKYIKEQTCIIRRSALTDLYDHFLNDDKYVLRNIDRIQLKVFPNGFRNNGSKVSQMLLVINGGGSYTPPSNNEEVV